MNELKTHYSAQELVDLALKTLPTTKKAILTRAKKQNWQSRKRVGKGGGVEYALNSLPQEIQTEIRTKFAVAAVIPQTTT